jgi:hypothetical protein
MSGSESQILFDFRLFVALDEVSRPACHHAINARKQVGSDRPDPSNSEMRTLVKPGALQRRLNFSLCRSLRGRPITYLWLQARY